MKNKNLFITLWLIIIWSLFFAIYKYFIWWVFKTDKITLQFISWFLSVWTIWAFAIWGLIYELFKEKRYHLFITIFTIIWILIIYFLNKFQIWKDYIMIWWMTIFLWFFYWLWWVLRTILVSTEINESNLSDTKINWFANISFISSIIIWSILWGYISDKFKIYWIVFIVLLILIWLLLWRFLNYKHNDDKKNIKERALEYKNSYLIDFKFIFKKYYLIMFSISLIITIATILSQKAIEYNIEILWNSSSISASILLYSAVGSIIWNIISMKVKKDRWLYFFIFSILFSISSLLFPLIIANFIYTSALAFISGLFFWIIYNLLESYFFKRIALDNKKSFWSATLWIITSFVISFLMFFVDFINSSFWFAGVYYFMSAVILIIWIVIFSLRNNFKI